MSIYWAPATFWKLQIWSKERPNYQHFGVIWRFGFTIHFFRFGAISCGNKGVCIGRRDPSSRNHGSSSFLVVFHSARKFQLAAGKPMCRPLPLTRDRFQFGWPAVSFVSKMLLRSNQCREIRFNWIVSSALQGRDYLDLGRHWFGIKRQFESLERLDKSWTSS